MHTVSAYITTRQSAPACAPGGNVRTKQEGSVSGKKNDDKAEKPKNKPKPQDRHVDLTVIVNGTPEAIKITIKGKL